jgi:tetratricopeptide (TPR) repeat protein
MVFHAHELYREAEKSYAAARALAPKDFRWPYLQAQCLKELEELDLALESAHAAGTLEASYVPLHLLQAFLHEQSNRGAEARSSYERALSLEPASAAAEFGLGRLKLASGELDDSLRHLERAAKLPRALHPEVPINDPLLALVQEEAISMVGYQQRAAEAEFRGDPERAEALLRVMLELQPEEPDRHYNLANTLSRQGRQEEAESSYRKALSLDPSYVPALIHLGILLSGRGDWVQAERLLEQALAVEPENPSALASLGADNRNKERFRVR